MIELRRVETDADLEAGAAVGITELRRVETDADLDAWAAVKSAVVPNEPVTADQLRATDEAGRLLLLAERAGEIAGCGIAAPSHFHGRAFVAPRVLGGHRRSGVGSALL